jgi:hypothetical protein
MRREGNVACIGEKKNAYRISVAKPEEETAMETQA